MYHLRSEADWKNESSLMIDVYGISSLNIAASGPLDSSFGCCFERTGPVKRQFHAWAECSRTIFDYVDGDFYRKLEEQPLS